MKTLASLTAVFLFFFVAAGCLAGDQQLVYLRWNHRGPVTVQLTSPVQEERRFTEMIDSVGILVPDGQVAVAVKDEKGAAVKADVFVSDLPSSLQEGWAWIQVVDAHSPEQFSAPDRRALLRKEGEVWVYNGMLLAGSGWLFVPKVSLPGVFVPEAEFTAAMKISVLRDGRWLIPQW